MVQLRNEDGEVVSIEGGVDTNGRITIDYSAAGRGWGQRLTLLEAETLVKLLLELIQVGQRQEAERYKNALDSLMRSIEDRWDEVDGEHAFAPIPAGEARYVSGLLDGIDQGAVLLDKVCEKFKLPKPTSRSVRARQLAKQGMSEAELLALPEVEGFRIGAIELDRDEYRRRRAAGQVVAVCMECERYSYVRDNSWAPKVFTPLRPTSSVLTAAKRRGTTLSGVASARGAVAYAFHASAAGWRFSASLTIRSWVQTSDGKWWQVGWVKGRRVRMERRPPPVPESWAEPEESVEPAFVPPTKDEVAAFAAQYGFDVDVEQFWQCYHAQDWKLASGVKMRDWREAVRHWRRTRT